MSSGFITESEASDLRQKRQAEWERVRKADDPLERPEDPFDGRSLFDRLQEQKQKKDLEYEEAHKLKNMIKGLDDDEVEFLDLVERTRQAADKKKELEEELELNDYRNRVAILQEKSIKERTKSEITVNTAKVAAKSSSQLALMKGVLRKTDGNKRKLSDKETVSLDKVRKIEDGPAESGLKCVAILPGLGCYEDSSDDSDADSSDSEDACPNAPAMDLLGRKVEIKTKETS